LKKLGRDFGTKIVGQKRCYFEKRSREVIENKESALKNKPKRTQNRTREVVENAFQLKKQTQNKAKTNPSPAEAFPSHPASLLMTD
jgi:hypothetical protein